MCSSTFACRPTVALAGHAVHEHLLVFSRKGRPWLRGSIRHELPEPLVDGFIVYAKQQFLG